MNPKLYILVRSDLTPGQQAVQAAHAAFGFARHHRGIMEEWFDTSEYLVLLQVPDERALKTYALHAINLSIYMHAQVEPDMDDAVTAVALEPGLVTQQLLSELPLALREESMV